MKFDLIPNDSISRAYFSHISCDLRHRKSIKPHVSSSLQAKARNWHFSDKKSAITQQDIKISKNGLQIRVREVILRTPTNFQPILRYSGNHHFFVDTLDSGDKMRIVFLGEKIRQVQRKHA